MKVQRLQIEQQMMQLGINSQRAALSIDVSQRRMKVESQDAQMTTDKEEPDVELDMRDFRNNNGIRDIKALMDESVAKAYRKVDQGIRNMVSDGNSVAALPSSGNSIGRVARSHLLEVKAPETDRKTVPYGPVKMKGDIGSLDIDWSKHDLKIEWDDYQSPQITVEPKPSVSVYVAQEPYIEFTVVEEMIPPEKGSEIDREI